MMAYALATGRSATRPVSVASLARVAGARAFTTDFSGSFQSDVCTSRIMLPDDANPAGNVHGGTILKMIDEAGRVAAMRHCNNLERLSKGEPALEVALARIGHMDFMSPVFIGNNTAVDARVTYASTHSMEVQVSVLAEDLMKGTRRVTNRATLWYVGIDRTSPVLQGDKDWSAEKHKTAKPNVATVHTKAPKLVAYHVPPVKFDSVQEEEAAHKRYTDQQLVRREDRVEEALALAEGRVQKAGKRLDLVQLLLPSHCSELGHVQGGVIMKLMDSAAGVSAVRFCKSNVVTASLGALNFKKPIFVGNVVTVSAWPSYTSQKTIEMRVTVTAEDLFTGGKYTAVSAYFTFVSLDPSGKTLDVPQLPPAATEAESEARDHAHDRYVAMREERQLVRQMKAESEAIDA